MQTEYSNVHRKAVFTRKAYLEKIQCSADEFVINQW
jgi:hypothetical protein